MVAARPFSILLQIIILFGFLVGAPLQGVAQNPAAAEKKECNGPFKNKRPSREKLKEMLAKHSQWVDSDGQRGEQVNLCKIDFFGADLQDAFLKKANLERAYLRGANLQGATLEKANLQGVQLDEANLEHAKLPETNLERASLFKANLQEAYLVKANLQDALLQKAKLQHANLREANLQRADLREANLQGAYLVKANLQAASLVDAVLPTGSDEFFGKRLSYLQGADLKKADISGVDLSGVELNLKPGGIPLISSFGNVKNLVQLGYPTSPHSLVEIRNGLKEVGMREQERILTYVIKHGELEQGRIDGTIRTPEYWFSYILFELTCEWGMSPGRPLRILGVLIVSFSLLYMLALNYRFALFTGGSGAILAVWPTEGKEEQERVTREFLFPKLQKRAANKWWSLPLKWACVPLIGLYFSLLSAFHIGWRDLNVGSWITRIQPREYVFRARGWVRVVSGLQSLISVYLLALWALTYFGRPFE